MGGIPDFTEQKYHAAVLLENLRCRVVWEIDFFAFLG